MSNIEELIFIDLDKEAELCNRDCFVDIAKKIQKALIESNIRCKDIEQSIQGYKSNSDKYHKLCSELKKLPNDINSYELIKIILNLLN